MINRLRNYYNRIVYQKRVYRAKKHLVVFKCLSYKIVEFNMITSVLQAVLNILLFILEFKKKRKEKMPTARGVPRWSPSQVLTAPDDA